MVNGVDGHTPQHIAGEVGEDVERIAVLEGRRRVRVSRMEQKYNIRSGSRR